MLASSLFSGRLLECSFNELRSIYDDDDDDDDDGDDSDDGEDDDDDDDDDDDTKTCAISSRYENIITDRLWILINELFKCYDYY